MTRRATAPDPQQLALFEAPAPVVEAVADAAPAVVPVIPDPSFQPVSIASVLSPATFRHPQADREIRLDEHIIGYALKRARRRSIGFIVGPEGLSVNAPKWVGLHDIEVALQEKAGWILRKLREQQERAQRLQAAKVDWRDGTSIPFLGEDVIVQPRLAVGLRMAEGGRGQHAGDGDGLERGFGSDRFSDRRCRRRRGLEQPQLLRIGGGSAAPHGLR